MSYLVYDQFLNDIMAGSPHAWTSGGKTYKLMAVTTSYPASASDVHMSDVTNAGGTTNYELNSGGGGSGYAAGFAGSGRLTLASGNRTLSIDSTNHRAYLKYTTTCSWAGINAGTIGGFIIYLHDTNDASSSLVCFLDPPDVITDGSTLTVTFDSNGVFYL